MSRPAVGPIQPPIQCLLCSVSLEVKQQGCEADYSSPFIADFKNNRVVPPLPFTGSVLRLLDTSTKFGTMTVFVLVVQIIFHI
jgi:hypothetical protein